MKHIALRSKSVRSGDRPYTTPGLGDRSHSLLLAYQYGKAHNTPVTIHLTDDKWSVAGGKKSDKKKKSWAELMSLFPKNSINIETHPVENLTEVEWIKYLKSKGKADNYIEQQKSNVFKIVIFRPSIVFGEADSFFNRFAK